MKIKILIIGIILILSNVVLSGCNGPENNNDLSPQITESFNINVSYPYKYWKNDFEEGTKVRVKGSLNELPDGTTPKADFLFFDGNTFEEFDQLSSRNSSSIDKTWIIPYDGVFFVGVEHRYHNETISGIMNIYW